MSKELSFESFASLIREQFALIAKTGKLFVSSVSGDALWDLYLKSFSKEDDPVFRDPNSSSNNCNRDHHFIKTYGNIVAVDDDNNNIVTMFDIDVEGSSYYNSVTAVRNVLKAAPISSVFVIHYNDLVKQPYEKIKKNADTFQLGYKSTNKQYTPEEVAKYGVVVESKVYTFHHFYVDLPKQYVLTGTESIGTYLSKRNSTHQVFVKGLNIPLETLQVVSELMAQGSLLRADLYKYKVDEFITIKQKYDNLKGFALSKDNWTWKRFGDIPFAGFANELVGTTCLDLAQGKDINEVCKAFNKYADPANYMKAKAPITERQKQDAANWIEENGYTASFQRRFATLEDALNGSINEVSHINISKKKAPASNLFANVKTVNSGILSRHKKAEFDAIETVDIQTFINSILPNSKSIQVFLENGFGNNLVTLTTAIDPTCKNPFKWNDNQFSWTYNGNFAGKSNLTQRVISKGGRVDGVLRFTHSWNELEPNDSLMDGHVFMPGNSGPSAKVCDNYGSGQRVGWNRRNDLTSGGVQDVDYVNAAPAGYIPVENITFPSLDKLKDGKYTYRIHNWNKRRSYGRGKAEIAFNGELYEYIYPATSHKEWVDVATVTLSKGSWSIEHHLEPVGATSNIMWGLDSNQFHKVNLISLSPNYWGENKIGNKHYFFFLEGCHSDSPMRSFHIENLNGELLAHRKVLEIYGMTDKLEPTTKQLAGLGFTDDSKETLIVKVEGSFKRTVRIKF
jgi:hypothetical protein